MLARRAVALCLGLFWLVLVLLVPDSASWADTASPPSSPSESPSSTSPSPSPDGPTPQPPGTSQEPTPSQSPESDSSPGGSAPSGTSSESSSSRPLVSQQDSLDTSTCGTVDAPCVVVLDTTGSQLNDWLTGMAFAAGVLVLVQLVHTIGGWRRD